MKLCVALIALCAVFAAVAAVPAGRQQMMYFQQHRPLYRAGQQAMLVHRYQAPKYASRRSSQEVGAFASGDSIEGATFIQDEQPTLQDGDAFSVAEAYPAEADDASAPLSADDAVNVAENDIAQPENEEYPLADAPAAAAPVAPVAPQHDAAVAPPKKHNKKKVAAAAPAPAAAEEADDSADDEFVPSLTKAGRPGAGGAGGAAQFPHTFFPMNFGSTSGGAIAVANSFSTGKGSAASHAVAYGSAASAKKRRND